MKKWKMIMMNHWWKLSLKDCFWTKPIILIIYSSLCSMTSMVIFIVTFVIQHDQRLLITFLDQSTSYIFLFRCYCYNFFVVSLMSCLSFKKSIFVSKKLFSWRVRVLHPAIYVVSYNSFASVIVSFFSCYLVVIYIFEREIN